MSAHVIMNLLNELWKKMQDLPSILSLFNLFKKSIILSQMLDSIYHMTLTNQVGMIKKYHGTTLKLHVLA